MSTWNWRHGADEHESLVVALRATLEAHGRRTSYAEWLAALGLGAAVVAHGEMSPAQWANLTRDAALAEAAELYGLRLRELHPRAAAQRLEHSAEFAAHFTDSYVPLIRRALQAGQVCLAWRGWAGPAAERWGVITEADGEELRGMAVGTLTEPTVLSGPAWQVYVVERCAPDSAPSTGQVFAQARAASRAFWSGAYDVDGVLTGAAALQRWRACVAEQRAEVVELARLVAVNREQLGRWLRSIVDGLPAAERDVTNAWAALCERTVAALRRASDSGADPAEALVSDAKLVELL